MSETPGDHRRYSEKEFALILRKATELQESGDAVGGAHKGGLSLSEIQQIAEEAGIDRGLVARAAALVDGTESTSASSRLFGPAASVHLTGSIGRALTDDDMSRLMEVVRYQVRQPGSVHEVLGSVVWKSDGSESALEVRMTPRDGRTHLEVFGDHSTIKGVFYTIGATSGLMASLIGMKLLGLPQEAIIPLGFGLGPVLGMLVSRPLWSSYAARLRSRLGRLVGMLEAEAGLRAIPEGSADGS